MNQVVEVFIPGRLTNILNGSWGHWYKHARIARDWRERTAQHLFVALVKPVTLAFLRAPKRVTFTLHVGRLWDDDALPAAVKPLRDAVASACCPGGDGPRSGNEFVYRQVQAKTRGVAVRVEVRDA